MLTTGETHDGIPVFCGRLRRRTHRLNEAILKIPGHRSSRCPAHLDPSDWHRAPLRDRPG